MWFNIPMKRTALLSILAVALCAPALHAAGAPTVAPTGAPAKAGALAAEDASLLAEKFVAAQGFADLQPKAVGARLDSDIWFVGFRAKTGESIHGIMVMNKGQKLKRVSQNLKLDWLMSKPEPEAPPVAAKAKAKTPAKKPATPAKPTKP